MNGSRSIYQPFFVASRTLVVAVIISFEQISFMNICAYGSREFGDMHKIPTVPVVVDHDEYIFSQKLCFSFFPPFTDGVKKQTASRISETAYVRRLILVVYIQGVAWPWRVCQIFGSLCPVSLFCPSSQRYTSKNIKHQIPQELYKRSRSHFH